MEHTLRLPCKLLPVGRVMTRHFGRKITAAGLDQPYGPVRTHVIPARQFIQIGMAEMAATVARIVMLRMSVEEPVDRVARLIGQMGCIKIIRWIRQPNIRRITMRPARAFYDNPPIFILSRRVLANAGWRTIRVEASRNMNILYANSCEAVCYIGDCAFHGISPAEWFVDDAD
jgi:hypothetical protein